MILIHGGSFFMGSEHGLENESPVHLAKVKDFYIDQNLVTVEQFRKFVEATGYKTDAEKFGNGAVFNFETLEWELVDGADWKFPEGKNSSAAIDDHPVTQVSWRDAVEYCKWANKKIANRSRMGICCAAGNQQHKQIQLGKFIGNE